MMSSIPTTRVVRLLPIVEGLKEIGHPVEKELRLAGLPANALDQPTALIPLYRFWRFAEQASLHSGNLALLAQTIEQTSFENVLVSGLVLSSPTLAAALDAFCHYSALEAPFARFSLKRLGDDVCFQMAIQVPDRSRGNVFLDIGAIAWMQRFVRAFVPFWRPERVFVCNHAIGDLPKELSLLGWRNISFGTDMNGFAIPRELLFRFRGELGSPGSGQAAHPARSDRHADLTIPETLTGSLRQVIMTYRRDQWLTVQQVADIAEMSPRSLQLHLTEEGMTFRKLIGDCRMHVAVTLLQGSDLSLEDIAREAGYSDRPTFIRAFRRWAGLNPMEFRRHRKA